MDWGLIIMKNVRRLMSVILGAALIFLTLSPTSSAQEHEHEFVKRLGRNATCTNDGAYIYICSCGASYTEKIAKKEHAYKQIVKKASVEKTGSMSLTCSVCQKLFRKTIIYSPASLKLKETLFVYNGKAKKPKVNVTDTKGNIIGSDNYKLSYKNNKKIGIATVIARFSGDYRGKLETTFKICSNQVKLLSLEKSKNGILVKWKKHTENIDGYQIQYSFDKDFEKKQTTSVNVKGKKSISKELTYRQMGKLCYVRIRAYTNAKLNDKKIKIYSDWSEKLIY